MAITLLSSFALTACEGETRRYFTRAPDPTDQAFPDDRLIEVEVTLDPAMRVLGSAEGLPSLPVSHLTLLSSQERATPAVEAMAQAIRHSFSGLSTHRSA